MNLSHVTLGKDRQLHCCQGRKGRSKSLRTPRLPPALSYGRGCEDMGLGLWTEFLNSLYSEMHLHGNLVNKKSAITPSWTFLCRVVYVFFVLFNTLYSTAHSPLAKYQQFMKTLLVKPSMTTLKHTYNLLPTGGGWKGLQAKPSHAHRLLILQCTCGSLCTKCPSKCSCVKILVHS